MGNCFKKEPNEYTLGENVVKVKIVKDGLVIKVKDRKPDTGSAKILSSMKIEDDARTITFETRNPTKGHPYLNIKIH
jgi:hypothetical protein